MCVIFIRSIKANSCYFHTSLVMQIIRSGRAKCFLFYPLPTTQRPKPQSVLILTAAKWYLCGSIEQGERRAHMIIVIIRKANYDNLSEHIPSTYSLVKLWIRCIMFDTTQQKTLRMLSLMTEVKNQRYHFHPCSVTNRLRSWLTPQQFPSPQHVIMLITLESPRFTNISST